MNIKIKIHIAEGDIDDIMVTALEGGINYWCDRVEIIKEPKGFDDMIPPFDSASHLISQRGNLLLKNSVQEFEPVILTKKKFKKGLQKFLNINFENFMKGSSIEEIGGMDAHEADQVLQYACFGKIVYD